MFFRKIYTISVICSIVYLSLMGFLYILFSDKEVTETSDNSNAQIEIQTFANLYNASVTPITIREETETTIGVVEETTKSESKITEKTIKNETRNENKKQKNETKKKNRNRWNITLADYEIEILCQIVMLESGGESDKGQQAVAEVILNRMYSDLFPDTLEGVLSQNGQFVTWSYRNSANVTDTVRKNVKRVLQGKTNVLPYNTLYFSVAPQNSKIQEQIGGHYFCNQ